MSTASDKLGSSGGRWTARTLKKRKNDEQLQPKNHKAAPAFKSNAAGFSHAMRPASEKRRREGGVKRLTVCDAGRSAQGLKHLLRKPGKGGAGVQ